MRRELSPGILADIKKLCEKEPELAGSKRVRAWLLLTPRETEVAVLIASGFTTVEIAQKLCITPKTVQTHLDSIFRTTGTNNRVQLLRFVLQEGLSD